MTRRHLRFTYHGLGLTLTLGLAPPMYSSTAKGLWSIQAHNILFQDIDTNPRP